jgi:UDPglucose 6-dehydrogenase
MISVIGLGFVGLTAALGFSFQNYTVYGFDTDEKKCRLLKKCSVPFYEPFLEDILKQQLNRNFFIVDDIGEAVNKSSIIFFCVGTPSKSDGDADLSYLLTAIESGLGKIVSKDRKVFVIKSTIPPGTTKEKIKPFISNLGFDVGKDIGLTNNPEFLREGLAWEDFIQPDRIVIGIDDESSGTIVESIYKPFHAPVFKVSLNTAEFIKYLSNTLLATMISFSNEMSIAARLFGNINIKNSFEILHMDKRWSGNPAKIASYAYPGCGFGGYCLPKDTLALSSQIKKRGIEPLMLESVLTVNKRIKEHVADTIMKATRKDEYIGILGLSFKPNTDDVRDSPAREVIDMLLLHGYSRIIAYDPLAMDNFKNTFGLTIEYAESIEDVARKAPCLVILTAWDKFKKEGVFSQNKVLDFRYFL